MQFYGKNKLECALSRTVDRLCRQRKCRYWVNSKELAHCTLNVDDRPFGYEEIGKMFGCSKQAIQDYVERRIVILQKKLTEQLRSEGKSLRDFGLQMDRPPLTKLKFRRVSVRKDFHRERRNSFMKRALEMRGMR